MKGVKRSSLGLKAVVLNAVLENPYWPAEHKHEPRGIGQHRRFSGISQKS